MRESELVATMVARDSSVTLLHEIDLGEYHLFMMNDWSIDLLAGEQAPYMADNVLSGLKSGEGASHEIVDSGGCIFCHRCFLSWVGESFLASGLCSSHERRTDQLSRAIDVARSWL